MKQITFTIDKAAVYAEIAKTTSYTGAKSGDAAIYERIFTTDEDQEFLERFWIETKSTLTNSLKRFLVSETESGGTYTIVLEVSNMYDDTLTESVQSSLFSFFVSAMISKWFAVSDKEETAGYATESAANLENIMRKIVHKVKPTRPTYE